MDFRKRFAKCLDRFREVADSNRLTLKVGKDWLILRIEEPGQNPHEIANSIGGSCKNREDELEAILGVFEGWLAFKEGKIKS